MSSEPRQHHLVTKAYLRRFADRRGRITVVSRDRPSVRRVVSVDAAATFRDYYTLKGDKWEDPYGVERGLGEIESAGLDALREACDEQQPLTAQRRDAVCRLAGYQYARGQRPRRGAEALAQVLDHVTGGRAIAPDGTILDHPPVEAQDPNERLASMISVGQEVVAHLVKLRLKIVRFDRPALLTADEPVHCLRYPGGSPLLGVGPASADEIWFPADPQTLVVFSPHETAGSWLMEGRHAAAAAMVNAAVATGAYLEIYMTPGRDDMAGFELPPPAPLIEVAKPHDFDVDGVNAPPVRKHPRRG